VFFRGFLGVKKKNTPKKNLIEVSKTLSRRNPENYFDLLNILHSATSLIWIFNVH